MSDFALRGVLRSARGAWRVVPGEYRTLGLLLMAWVLWAVVDGFRAGSGPYEVIRYSSFALALAGGIVLGRWGAFRAGAWAVPAATAAFATGVSVAPLYANGQAAVGVQVAALAALMILRIVARDSSTAGAAAGVRAVFIAVTAVLGVLLASLSQATVLLVVVVTAIAGLAISRSAPDHRVILGAGLGLTGIAALVVLVLANLRTWPGWLADSESLSLARHHLWEDALLLWSEYPFVGGGPGSFYSSSEFAQSDPLYYAAHSSVLQVGAELGIIGVLIFLCILVVGAVCASRQGTSRALLGVSAWCALAVHSMIDHVYEFSVVTLAAGAVIGWAGAGAPWRVRGIEV